jgi:cytochrome c oxidase subunit 3
MKINKFQHFPFHLVDPSPWPILLSFTLLNMAIGAVLYMHGYNNGGFILTIGFLLTVLGMILWFRDVITEGRALSLIITQRIVSNLIYFIFNTFS